MTRQNTGDVVEEDGKTSIYLYPGGPRCPECDGPTFRVAEDEYQKPWWCPDCNLRVPSEDSQV